MFKRIPIRILLCALFLSAVQDGEIQMEPFVMDWRNNSESLLDLSFLNEVPAGKGGFITVEKGHFVKPDGTRFRIWGINVTVAACFPPKNMAATIAAYLARFGINTVRFHFLDSAGPESIFSQDSDNTRALDPEQLDKLDFFIAELKKRGVYSNLNLNTARCYRQGDGVKDYEYIGLGKILHYFDEHVLSLHKEYARQLLTHFNPYTKSEYRNEPAVVIVELINENSIVEAWTDGRIDGTNQTKHPAAWMDMKTYLTDLGKLTWVDITPGYARQLTRKYNDWLEKNLSFEEMKELRRIAGVEMNEPVPRLRRDQIRSVPSERFHREAAFYTALERAFFKDLYRFLKYDLGVHALIVGSADHNMWKSGYAFLSSASELDVIDGHVYWQLPRDLSVPNSDRKKYGIQNTPMVRDPFYSTVVQLSRSALAGKPFTISEINHPFPSEYACEGIGIIASYAAFHDWDGVYYFTLSHYDPRHWQQEMMVNHYEIRADPVTMTNLAAGALIFLRGDVKSALETIPRSYSEEQVRESLRLPLEEKTFFTPGFSLAIPLRHTTRIQSFQTPSGSYPETREESPLVSDTGELAWSFVLQKTGFVSVETKKTQALIGFIRDYPKTLANLSASVENEFGSRDIVKCCVWARVEHIPSNPIQATLSMTPSVKATPRTT